MAHNGLILGRSQYGKSSLAKALAIAFKAAGRRVLVYDILDDNWAGASVVVSNKEEFLNIFWNSFDIIAFIEEGGEVANRREKEIAFTSTRGRHQIGDQGFGNSCYYSTHRLNQLDVTLRAQCPELYLFASRHDDARDLVQEYGQPRLIEAPALPPGVFFHVLPGEDLKKYKIDFATLKIERIYEK
jgi:hypothetical protein